MRTLNKTVPFFRPSFSAAEYEAVKRVLDSGWLTSGPEARAFEKEFAEYVGCEYALTVNSATSGLILSMEAAGVKRWKKILTTPYTFVSTATSALHLGAEVVYADVLPNSYLIDPAEIERILKNDPNICAVVPVHIAGEVCAMKEIREIAKKYSVAVIEDAAHAFPSRTPEGFAGTLSDAGVFSFYATKTITTGEGGMVCTNNKAFADRIRLMRSHGIDRPIWDRYTNAHASWQYDLEGAGYKFNLPDILAAIGREQLKKADVFFRLRKAVADQFTHAFSRLPVFSVPHDSIGHAWHLYLLQIVPAACTVSRDAFAYALQEAGIGISVHFIPHTQLSFFKQRYGFDSTVCPNAADMFNRTISLPLWPGMSEEDVDYVIETVISLGKKFSR